MRKFYVPDQCILADKITVGDKFLVHHLRDVLRVKAGDLITVFSGSGAQYECVIDKIAEDIILNIKNKRMSSLGRDRIMITAACAIPKHSKFDDIVDRLTQLGIDRIIPLETERVIVKLDKNKKLARATRWEKIALSAAEQSQRNSLPVIDPVSGVKDVLSKAGKFDLKFIPTLEGQRKTLKEVFLDVMPKNILYLIGPEGDFTPEEVELAKKAGCTPVSLGDSVLRVETAAVAVLSFIRFHFIP